jgi:hypothetical protein
VPVKTGAAETRQRKCKEIHEYYKANNKLAFVHVTLLDNRSDFLSPLQIEVRREAGNYVIAASGATVIANSIAYLSELLDPVAIYLGLTQLNPMEQALRFLLFGEGETGTLVYTILLRHWEQTPEEDVQPYIFLMSEGNFAPLPANRSVTDAATCGTASEPDPRRRGSEPESGARNRSRWRGR